MISTRSAFQCTPDQVHVWWIDLNQIASRDDMLTPAEHARGARFRYPRDRERWTAARVALRQILARYTGNAPETLLFATAPGGKPALAPRSPFRFSLAHAEDRAALAVSWQREVGIDLEPSTPVLPGRHDVPALMAASCTAAEAARIEALPVEEQLEAFVQIWTLKEAYLKGIGAGLTREPRTLEVIIGEDGRAEILDSVTVIAVSEGSPDNSAVPRWSLHLLTPGARWLAALAIAGDTPQISEHSWPEAYQPA